MSFCAGAIWTSPIPTPSTAPFENFALGLSSMRRVSSGSTRPRTIRTTAFRENTGGPLVLGRACKRLAIGLLSFSSDLVFDGRKSSAYVESDRPSPLGVYGHTKAEAERQLEHEAPQALIIRTSAFFGPWDCHNFVAAVLRTVRGGGVFTPAKASFRRRTYRTCATRRSICSWMASAGSFI